MINESQQLSDREREILGLVANGLSNQQIANELGISVNTVKVHLRNVFAKIGAASRTEASMYAVRAGIVAVDRPRPDAAPLPAAVAEPAPTVAADATPVAVAADPASPAIDAAPDQLVTPRPDAIAPALVAVPDAGRPARRAMPRRWLVLAVVATAALLGGVWAIWGMGRGADALGTGATAETEQDRWSEFPSMRQPRAGFAVSNFDDRIYVVGGENASGVLADVERYDTRSQTWTALSRKPTPVADARAVRIGDKVYVPGGRLSADPGDITAVVERYDPRAESWETVRDLPAPRSGYALAALEGKLYLFGGWDGTSFRAEVFEFDPETERWRERQPMPTARAFSDAVVVGGSIYVMGGENERGAVASNEQFVPALDDAQAWSKRPPLPQPTSRFGSAAVLSGIYLFGGANGDNVAQLYDVRTERWQSFPTPQILGSAPGVALLDDTIYCLGGELADGTYHGRMLGYQALFRYAVPLR